MDISVTNFRMMEMLLKIILLLPMTLAVSGTDNEDASFKELVISELGALKSKVSELENTLQATEHENIILSDRLKHARSLGESSFYPENEVAFSARVSQHVKNLTAHQVIVFDNLLTNIGNYYNNTTGVFYVPVAGTYQFFVNILSEANNNIETELVVNGNQVAEIYSGAGKFHGAGSNLVIVRLKHGDNVWVKVHAAYSTDMSVHCCWSTFSGILLREIASQSQIVG